MIFHAAPIPGAFVIELEKRGDERGFFARAFCAQEFAAHDLPSAFVQVNNSLSGAKGTLRGMHYQLAPKAETKLVRCIRGALFDVILDLRKGSATFGRSFGTELTAENRRMMYVPKGFAHGFVTLADNTEAFYFVDEFYAPACERCIRWDDPRFAIEWPQPPLVISDKDGGQKDFDFGLASRAVKVLFTGGSSFTGYWFMQELARAGHEIVAAFRKRPEEYADELRRERVAMSLENCRGVFGCSFGDPEFLELARGERWDLLCHHAADVTNYKSPDFDPVSALAGNTRSIAAVLHALRPGPARPRVLLTGSVFENDEGAGSEGLPAFSPYGLSKSLTYQVFRYYAARAGLALGKFVIPNPFGPYEEPRFTGYLMKTWLAGQTASVSAPAYVRDNIHVSLLAKVYAKFAHELPDRPGLFQIHPSGYAEMQGSFALRFAQEMRPRLGLPCEVVLQRQVEFPEPRVRINTEVIDAQALGWDEARAWDEIAAFYVNAVRGR